MRFCLQQGVLAYLRSVHTHCTPYLYNIILKDTYGTCFITQNANVNEQHLHVLNVFQN